VIFEPIRRDNNNLPTVSAVDYQTPRLTVTTKRYLPLVHSVITRAEGQISLNDAIRLTEILLSFAFALRSIEHLKPFTIQYISG